jgi:hypothetical protein
MIFSFRQLNLFFCFPVCQHRVSGTSFTIGNIPPFRIACPTPETAHNPCSIPSVTAAVDVKKTNSPPLAYDSVFISEFKMDICKRFYRNLAREIFLD